MRLEVPVLVRDVGLKVTVSPAGAPTELKATEELKPLCMVKVSVLLTVAPPLVTLRLAGATESAKLLTVSVKLVVRTCVPFVPVTVIGYAPAAVEVATESARVEVPEPETDVGVNTAVTPAGKPLAVNPVLPPNPVEAVKVIRLLADPPADIVLAPPFAKVNPARTVKFNTKSLLKVPLVPLSVTG